VPQLVQRDFARHGDRGGVNQLADAGADEGHAEDGLGLLVDDHLGVARVAVFEKLGPRYAAGFILNDADGVTRGFGLLSGQAYRANLGDREDHLGDAGLA
jgi:hypothetical protein